MQNSLTTKEQSILATFEPDEVWEVKTQDKTYQLNGSQAQGLRDATSQGLRGLIWFKDFAISIPHITSVYRIKKSNKVLDEQRALLIKKFTGLS